MPVAHPPHDPHRLAHKEVSHANPNDFPQTEAVRNLYRVRPDFQGSPLRPYPGARC